MALTRSFGRPVTSPCSSPSEEALARARERIALQRSFGVDVRIISPQDAREIIPALAIDDLVAAVHCPTDGHAGPYEVTMGYAARARERGVRFVEDTLVTDVLTEGDRVVGVETTAGTIATPIVVNVAGLVGGAGRTDGRADLKVMPRRERHIFVTDEFPEIAGPTPHTADQASGFYFRKEQNRLIMSPGDAEDLGSDFESRGVDG